ncbi:MAG: glycosyltransferase family 9 protein [Lentisphaerae bacterium]|nr:glycosyltransferase family 9 protein [Lentisphaerota bacterium]
MNYNKLLLIYSGWLGDLVWIIPTIRALRTRFSHVSIVASEIQEPLALLLQGNLLDNVFIDHRRRRLASAAKSRRMALAEDIGTFVDLKGRGKAGLYIPWHPGTRVFSPSRKNAREYILSRILHPMATEMPDHNDKLHMVDSYLETAQFLGAKETPVCFDIPFSKDVIANADRIIDKYHLQDGRSVAISLGSAQLSKIWPAIRYRQLAEIIENDLGYRVVIMGGASFAPNANYDFRTAREFFGDGRFVNLVAETNFAVDCRLLRSGVFGVIVGNDSFAGHMAGAVNEMPPHTAGSKRAPNGKYYKGLYSVTIFGPTNPEFCKPYDPTGYFNIAIQPRRYPPDCPYNRSDHICPHYADAYCVKRNHCMDMISVEQVAATVKQQLQKL